MAFLWAALCGLVTSAAFYPLALWPAIFVGIAGLYLLNRDQNFKRRLALNFTFGVAFQIISLYWIGTYVGWYAWLALVVMQATFLMVLSFANHPLTFASAWILFEFILRSFPFGGFGWSRLGFALTETPLNFLYPRVGISGVAFLAVLISALIVNRQWRGTAVALSALAIISLLPISVIDGKNINVALVQGGQIEKLDNTFENAEAAISKHFIATKKIPENSVDLVIWPENAVMHDPFLRKTTNQAFLSEADRINAPILVNANLRDGTNGSVLLGDVLDQRYSKRYLTPFGEFIPFRSIVERINEKAKRVSGYQPGQNPYLFRTESGTFRTLICYELLSDLQARSEMGDADFIVTQTNNATYFQTWQLDQELAIAKARSAETSRHSAYVSTTGGTSLIDEDGRVVESLPKYANAVLIGEVTTRSGITLATKFGGYLELLLIALGFIPFVTRLLKRQSLIPINIATKRGK